MSANKKATRLETGAASNIAFDNRNSTKTDCLIGSITLAKPSRNRQQKRGWQRGAIKAKFKGIIVRLALWGLISAGFATWLIQRAGLKHA